MKISKIAKLCKDAKLVCMTSTEAEKANYKQIRMEDAQ